MAAFEEMGPSIHCNNIGHRRTLFQRFYHVVRARANKVPLAKRVRLEKENFARGIVYV